LAQVSFDIKEGGKFMEYIKDFLSNLQKRF
jgi:hypothetical protein